MARGDWGSRNGVEKAELVGRWGRSRIDKLRLGQSAWPDEVGVGLNGAVGVDRSERTCLG